MKKKNRVMICTLSVLCLFLMFANSCSNEDITLPTVVTVPVLTTSAVSSITSITASSGGNITSDGGATVTARGVCWGIGATPTTADSKTTDGTGIGSFTSVLNGLAANTTYNVRAYATNSKGTAYGSAKTFTTLPISNLLPVLTTTDITSISATTATSGGNISSDGGTTITERGICWSTTQNPTVANTKTSNGTGIGSFTCNLTGLTSNTAYYVRAFATNSDGTGYGNEISFSTMGTVTDARDGNVYKTITIGTQTWMAQNLNWQPAAYSADWKIYGNIPNNGLVYGALYNYTLSNKAAQGFSGWRIPTDNDWKTLIDYLGGYQFAGAKLKEASTMHWTTPNAGSTNSSGFTALGSGYYDLTVTMSFLDLKDRAYYWTSTPYTTYIVIYSLRFDDSWAHGDIGDKSNYYSIRLVKN